MKKFISVVAICVIALSAWCIFYNIADEKDSDLKENATETVEEVIEPETLYVKEEVESTVPEETMSEEDTEEYIVYRTKTGERYHRERCRFLSKSCIEITLEEAENRGLTACGICNP